MLSPIFEEYREQLKSEIADMLNSPGRPAGLTIPLDRPAPRLLVWPSKSPWWTFSQVADESVNEREQDLVSLVRSFGPRVRDEAA